MYRRIKRTRNKNTRTNSLLEQSQNRLKELLNESREKEPIIEISTDITSVNDERFWKIEN